MPTRLPVGPPDSAPYSGPGQPNLPAPAPTTAIGEGGSNNVARLPVDRPLNIPTPSTPSGIPGGSVPSTQPSDLNETAKGGYLSSPIAPVVHGQEQHHGFKSRLGHAALGAGLGFLSSMANGGDIGRGIGGALTGLGIGAISPKTSDYWKFNDYERPAMERQAQADYQDQQRRGELEKSKLGIRKAESDIKENDARTSLLGAQRDALLAKPTRLNTHVVGNALVDDDGKILYQGPDAVQKWQSLPGAAEPTLYDPATGAIKPTGVPGKPPSNENQVGKDKLAHQQHVGEMRRKAKDLQAKAARARASGDTLDMPDAQTREAFAKQYEVEAANLLADAADLEQKGNERFNGSGGKKPSGQSSGKQGASGPDGDLDALRNKYFPKK